MKIEISSLQGVGKHELVDSGIAAAQDVTRTSHLNGYFMPLSCSHIHRSFPLLHSPGTCS